MGRVDCFPFWPRCPRHYSFGWCCMSPSKRSIASPLRAPGVRAALGSYGGSPLFLPHAGHRSVPATNGRPERTDLNEQRRQVAQFAAFVVRSLFVLVAAYTVQEILTVPPRYERLGAKVLTALGIGLLFYALTRFVTLYIRNRVNCESGLWNACKRKASTCHSQYSGSSWTGRAQILATGRRPTATLPRRRPASVLKTQSARRPAN